MPSTEGSGSRRGPQRQGRPRLLVVCGGERTEPAYFEGIRELTADRAVDLKILGKGQSPQQVVRYAVSRAGADFDDVWCVLDVDDFDLSATVRLAEKENVRLAISNPCFELWLLLHHDDCKSACNRCAGAVRLLKRHVRHYDKTKLAFADYAAGIDKAIARARRMAPTGEEHTRNPSSGVWVIAEMIVGVP